MPVVAKCSGSILCGFVLSASILTLSPAAHAAPVLQFNIQVLGGTAGPYNNAFAQNGTQTAPGSQIYNYQNPPGGISDPVFNEWSILNWDFNADNNPSGSGMETGARLGSAFTIQNNRPDGPTAADNHLYFSIMVTMTIDQPIPTPSTAWLGNGGQTLTINDSPNNFPGELRAIGTPIWNYMVNGTDAAGLFLPGYFLGGSDGPATTSSGASLSAAQTAALVGLTPTTIGIRLDFDLSPGERVTFNGVFSFVPAPGALALLGFAGLAGASRRRRA